MPSHDDTYVPIQRLHRLFAVSALLLLAVTVGMIVADHHRPWKNYQRQFHDTIEPWTTQAQLRTQQNDAFRKRDEVLAQAVAQSERAVPERALLLRFIEAVNRDASQRGDRGPDLSPLWAAYEALAAHPSVAARTALLARLDVFVAAARLRQQNVERQLRFRRAEFDEQRSHYEVAVGQHGSRGDLDRRQHTLDRLKSEMAELAAQADAAAAHNQALADAVLQMRRGEQSARQSLAEHRMSAQRLERMLAQQRPNWGKWLLRLPLVDAFGQPLAVQQNWLPELTINYNFRQVARFDRCTTCHQGIARAVPGTPAAGLWPHETRITVQRMEQGGRGKAEGGRVEERTASLSPPPSAFPLPPSLYGLELAEHGMLNPQEATIGRVLPRSAAADAGLVAGDVIEKINGRTIPDRRTAEDALHIEAASGKPLLLEIRRGLPHPFASHPRLDLFVGSQSPHPAAQFGCTICHDGQGSATDFTWASHTPDTPTQRTAWRQRYEWFANENWDYPMLPAHLAESRCLKCHHDVSDLEPSPRFPDPPAAKLVAGYHLVRQYGCFGCHEIHGFDDAGRPLGPDMRLEPAAQVANGSLSSSRSSATGGRAALPPGTLRKVGPSLRDVADRADARFVENWIRHPAAFRPATRMPRLYGLHEHLKGRDLADAQRFEDVEIRAIGQYLLATSRSVKPLDAPSGVTEPARAERGKRLFQTAGCLACHRHHAFPDVAASQGPDLTNLGAQITSAVGRAWLTDWIREPTRHSPRTKMPALTLEPIPLDAKDPAGAAKVPRTDPAADIAAWLLTSKDWHPESSPPLVETDLDQLALLYLRLSFPTSQATAYLAQGIPASLANRIAGDEQWLLAPITVQKKLQYVGRRTIRRRGCFGCHDIAGMDDALPIGPALSDWGRKPISQLAFEQVDAMANGAGQGGREGFLCQKLRAPRSFDYRKTQNKGYLEQLTMGHFTLTDAEREAIITFILGLVAEPPAEKYVFHPDRRQQAIVQGRKVLDQFACAECHTLEMGRWTIQYDPAKFKLPPPAPNFHFLQQTLSPEAVAASRKTDRRGLGQVELVGIPRLDAKGQLQEDEDDDGNPLYGFSLWEPAAIDGQLWPVGGADVLVGKSQIVGQRPPWGGAFARWLYPLVLAQAKAAGAQAAPAEAWGWVPPALVHEGRRVQPAWLFDYLLSPWAIRPAGVLRMPRFNLSPAEAGVLVDYFAAVDGVEFPYVSNQRPAQREPRSASAMDGAMRLVLDRKTFCAKCHLIGDYSPGGEIRTVLAPNLAQVGQRIRPDYLRRWLADPKSVLPYTPMPVNFPPTGGPLGQDLYRASSVEQLDAVLEFLLDYNETMNRGNSVRRAMEQIDGGKP
jgi:cytochrome c2